MSLVPLRSFHRATLFTRNGLFLTRAKGEDSGPAELRATAYRKKTKDKKKTPVQIEAERGKITQRMELLRRISRPNIVKPKRSVEERIERDRMMKGKNANDDIFSDPFNTAFSKFGMDAIFLCLESLSLSD